jgi:hypothetical protein
MWKFIIGAFVLYMVIDLIGSCNKAEVEQSSGDVKNEISRQLEDSMRPDTATKEGIALADSLTQVYKKKGYGSWCQLKADLDSIYLVSIFMADVCMGKEISKERDNLKSRIEKDKLKIYYQTHGLNSKQVLNDLFLMAVIYPDPCKDYLDKRYRIDKYYIENDYAKQLYIEAFKKYKY